MKVVIAFRTMYFLIINNVWELHSKQINQNRDVTSVMSMLLTNPEDFLVMRETGNDQYHRQVQGLSSNPPTINITECSNATEYFSWRTSNDVNLYQNYYNCQCTGDLNSKFTMVCSLDNYCFMENTNRSTGNASSMEQCISRSFTYDFLVNTTSGTINKLEMGRTCTEYITKNGPFTGKLCANIASICSVLMLNDHGYTTEESSLVCSDQSTCRKTLPTLGYTSNRVDDLCPYTTLNDKECKSPGYVTCGEYNVTSQIISIASPDCSNVEPCATSSCQQFSSPDESPQRFLARFPQCPGGNTGVANGTTMPEENNNAAYSATISVHIMLTLGLLFYLW